jgi:diphthine-ammonia ligase
VVIDPPADAAAVYAIAWSGGKDSMLALDRALTAGYNVRFALNLYNAESGRVQFHGTPRTLIEHQVRMLGLTPLQLGTGDDDFEATFGRGLDELVRHRVRGVIFGNVHLADVREWYETRTRARGLEHLEPLWNAQPGVLLGELLARRHRALIVSVDLSRGREAWLGREITASLAAELLADSERDPLGEKGEYHTLVFAGPRFGAPIELRTGERWEMRGHALLDTVLAR